MSYDQSKVRLGDLLVQNFHITEEQLSRALLSQKAEFKPLGEILIEQGAISEFGLLKALANQRGYQPWDLEIDQSAPDAVALLTGLVCKHYQVLPVRVDEASVTLAMRNPDDTDAIEAVRGATGLDVVPVLASEKRLAMAIEEAYPHEAAGGRKVDALITKAMDDYKENFSDRNTIKRQEISEEDDSSVVTLVNQILVKGIQMRASDIHIEPRPGRMEVRYRVDGQLRADIEVPGSLMPMLAARLKIMAELDIVENRIPQDGRIGVNVDGRTIDLRVSILPNYYGPRIVMRILDRASALKQLDELGFNKHNINVFRNLVEKPYGMLFVTGPTGSGKTTTLYAALNEIKHPGINIMTCEDPVEYDLDGINQSQVNEKVGLTFAAQLRAILRQDPDVVLVGEVRDKETADTAIRAALTGHLVLSTLHANDAPSAIPRLLDMQIDPFMLSTSLIGVMAQRLLRRLCQACRQRDLATAQELELLSAMGYPDVKHIFRPKGCPECDGSGYRGRMAVHEIMPVTDEVGKMIASGKPIEETRQCAESFGYRPMQLDALDRVVLGLTTIDEAKRVIYFDTIKIAAAKTAAQAGVPVEVDLPAAPAKVDVTELKVHGHVHDPGPAKSSAASTGQPENDFDPTSYILPGQKQPDSAQEAS